jgi:hypothetical protein
MDIRCAVLALAAFVTFGWGAMAQSGDDFAAFYGTWGADCGSADLLTVVPGGGTPTASLSVDGRHTSAPVEGFGEEKGMVVSDDGTDRLFNLTVSGSTLRLSYFSGRDKLPEVTVAGALLVAGGEAVSLQRCDSESAAAPASEGPVVQIDKFQVRVLTPDELVGSWGHSSEHAAIRPFSYACPGWEGKEKFEAEHFLPAQSLPSPDGDSWEAVASITFARDREGAMWAYQRNRAAFYFEKPEPVEDIRQDSANQLTFRMKGIDYTLKRTKFLKWSWTAAGEKVETFNLNVVESPFFLYDLSYKYPEQLNREHEEMVKCLP